MKDLFKKIGLFLLVIAVLILFSNLIYKHLLPIKPVRLVSGNMEPNYFAGDILFYQISNEYDLNDVVLLSGERSQPIVTRIISANEDGSYTLKGDHNPTSLNAEQNVKKGQFQGKIKFSANPIFFYGIDYGLKIAVALIVVLFVFKKKQK